MTIRLCAQRSVGIQSQGETGDAGRRGGAGVITEVYAFGKASGIWGLSLIGAGTLASILIEGKAENIDLGAGWCVELMREFLIITSVFLSEE